MSTIRLAALAAGFALITSSVVAQSPTKIRFTLDWKLQGIYAWYYWAQNKGYFAAEKLDVTIDQGEGSAATVTRIMSGPMMPGLATPMRTFKLPRAYELATPPIVEQVFDRAFLLPKADRMLANAAH